MRLRTFLGRRFRILLALVVAGGLLLAGSARALAGIGASALLHPQRIAAKPPLPSGCQDDWMDGADGIRLRAWRCAATAPRRGTLIYLHGVADSRAGAGGIAQHFTARGYDVVAYDSRAHGESQGEACTYGFFEKRDLRRVIDTLPAGPVVLLGNSLGAAVALQAAAIDTRITAIVAAETFSDLRTVAAERAPFVFTKGTIRRAFARAEEEGHFVADDVSPVRAARAIRIPVLLVHGEADRETPPAHSRRVFDALAGPKRLLLVPGAHHSESLGRMDWGEIDDWIDASIGI